MVRAVTIMGKIGQEVECDALVLCTGAYTARFLHNTLRVCAPLTPIKSYTFTVPTQCDYKNTHLVFKDKALTAVQVEPKLWRMSLFGDLAGFNLDLDNRRVRQAKNEVCVTIDTKEGLMASGIQAVLRTCSPDDLPVIGALKTNPNLYINSGHGGRNCAISIGSSRLVAEIMTNGQAKSCP